MATIFKSLKDYLYPDKGNVVFEIPNYQRGYKWSVKLAEEETSVEDLITRLITSYNQNRKQKYFLQGVTVVEEGDRIILIDGQQRTTTLYLLLWCLDPNNIRNNRNITLEYKIRPDSQKFLTSLKDDTFYYEDFDKENKSQDIYYFKQAIKQIKEKISVISNKKDFTEYLLNNISLLYIEVDKAKAVRTFTMMNGNKAKMRDEELVKAELLHLVSIPEELKDVQKIFTLNDTFSIFKEVSAMDWETNSLRSKYAREWDKWLYWWNRKDVQDCFDTNNPMGLLLELYCKKNGLKEFSFKVFKNELPDGNKRCAKETFKKLRDLQKGIEDVFNNPLMYNLIRLAFIISNKDDKYDIISFYLDHKGDIDVLIIYAKLRLVGCTHNEIVRFTNNDASNSEDCKIKFQKMFDGISKNIVYNNDGQTDLERQLLRLNVKEYNKLNSGKGIKFDFGIWKRKSLEHIYPKSKFFHTEEDEDGNIKFVRGDGKIINERDSHDLLNSNKVFSNPQKYSEHCIGNLVLLYGNNNSTFGALDFVEKKKKFFNNEIAFESRNLLHTISVFANNKWEISDIEKNAEITLNIIKNDYSFLNK